MATFRGRKLKINVKPPDWLLSAVFVGLVVGLVVVMGLGFVSCISRSGEELRLSIQRERAVRAGKAEYYWDEQGNMHWRLLHDADPSE